MPDKIDAIEKEKRLRIVMEWILEDWPSKDIIANIVKQWDLSERHAKRYLAEARSEWVKQGDQIVEQKRKLKIESLKKLKRSLKDQFKGTPLGIRAILSVEKQIIELEGLKPAQKVELTGKNGGPIETQSTLAYDEIDYSQLPVEVLETLMKARKKKSHVESAEGQPG